MNTGCRSLGPSFVSHPRLLPPPEKLHRDKLPFGRPWARQEDGTLPTTPGSSDTVSEFFSQGFPRWEKSGFFQRSSSVEMIPVEWKVLKKMISALPTLRQTSEKTAEKVRKIRKCWELEQTPTIIKHYISKPPSQISSIQVPGPFPTVGIRTRRLYCLWRFDASNQNTYPEIPKPASQTGDSRSSKLPRLPWRKSIYRRCEQYCKHQKGTMSTLACK